MVVPTAYQFSILYFYFNREEVLAILLYTVASTLLIFSIVIAVLKPQFDK